MYIIVILVGLDGDAVTVEDLVQQALGSDERDTDESIICCSAGDHVLTPEAESSPYAYTGGHWMGWHCEGSPLRTLFGLLMWDILFLGDFDYHCLFCNSACN